MARLAAHGNGMALIFARTETDMFHRYVWGRAAAVLFLAGRRHFYTVDGQRAKHNGGAPSCLVAYGESNAEKLWHSRLPGALITDVHNIRGGTHDIGPPT